MTLKVALAGATAALALVPAASVGAPDHRPHAHAAGLGWELKAADEVQRVASHRYRRYTWVASCRSIAKTRFTCDIMGYKGSSFGNGRATVKKVNRYRYRVTSLNVNFT